MENYKAQHAEVVPDAKDKNAMVQIEKCFATETLNKIHKKSVRGPNLRKKTTQLKPKKALKPRASGGAKRKRKKKAPLLRNCSQTWVKNLRRSVSSIRKFRSVRNAHLSNCLEWKTHICGRHGHGYGYG